MEVCLEEMETLWKYHVCIIAQTIRKRQESVGPHWEGL